MKNLKFKNCKACGKELDKSANVCPSCGKDQRNFFKKHKILTAILAFIVIIFTFASLGDDSTETSKVTSNNTTAEEKAEKEAEDNVPMEYKQALKSAQNYIDVMAFSKQGLYDQLTSEYAEKYSDEAAQYAIDNVKADYKEEAVEAAQNYLDTMSFSKEGLKDQLTSQYADKYTEEEAQYAIDKVYK